jgi:hypothetical protein
MGPLPILRINGGVFTALNGTGGGDANGNTIVAGGATLNIGGSWSGNGRVTTIGGAVNVAGGLITGTNIFNANGGDVKLTDETITQGTTAGPGGQVRAGGPVGGTVDIVDGTITFGQVNSRAVDGLGTVNLDGVKLVDVLIDTTNFGAGHNVIQTIATGTILDGDTSQPGNPNGVINTAHLVVQDGTDLTLEGTIDNRLFVDPGHPGFGDPTYKLGYSGIFLNGSTHDTTLRINGDVNLIGGGRVVMSDIPGGADSVHNVINGTNPDTLGTGTTSVTLTTNNIIMGSGNIGLDDGSLSVTNIGTIAAISARAPLTIDLGDEFAGTRGTLNNAGGTLESSGAGVPGGGATLPPPAGAGGLFINNTNVNDGTMVIATDSFVDSNHSQDDNLRIKFNDISGNTGMLFLGSRSTFAGTTAIEGFAGSSPGASDQLDFQGLRFGVDSKAEWTQGVGQGTLAITSGALPA